MPPISNDLQGVGAALEQLIPHVCPQHQLIAALLRRNLFSLAERAQAMERACVCPLHGLCPSPASGGESPAQTHHEEGRHARLQ